MATSTYSDPAAAKGKMAADEPEVSDIISLNPTDSNKIIEVIIYCKWVSRHVHTRQAIRFCCMLIDKHGTPIQANMDAKDTYYFNQLLELGNAYRITGFSCELTGPWERTLENPVSLAFGKFISLQRIPNTNFPEHYFNFVSYNELPAKLEAKNAVLTGVSGVFTFGDATSDRTHRRIINIQNLSGHIIRLTLWHEMALNFNIQEYEAMSKPVIIAVSSCWVRQYNGLQLSGTSTTHYYLNPNIPETYHIKQHCQETTNPVPLLNIDYHRYQDPEVEKNHNRFPLATLLMVNPQNYQCAHFTSYATIYKISTQNKWYYERCTDCGKQLIPSNPIATCKDHGPQPTPTYSYCFRAIIGDGSGTISLTCFSNQANTLVKDINELLAEISDKHPYHVPAALKQLEGTTHTFQFHFDVNSTTKRKVFVLDTIFKETTIPLPAPPNTSIVPESTEIQEPTPLPPAQPSSPTFSTSTSKLPITTNQEKTSTDFHLSQGTSTHGDAPKSTPPHLERPLETHKQNKPSNFTQPTTRKTLFKEVPGSQCSEVTKKTKTLKSMFQKHQLIFLL